MDYNKIIKDVSEKYKEGDRFSALEMCFELPLDDRINMFNEALDSYAKRRMKREDLSLEDAYLVTAGDIRAIHDKLDNILMEDEVGPVVYLFSILPSTQVENVIKGRQVDLHKLHHELDAPDNNILNGLYDKVNYPFLSNVRSYLQDGDITGYKILRNAFTPENMDKFLSMIVPYLEIDSNSGAVEKGTANVFPIEKFLRGPKFNELALGKYKNYFSKVEQSVKRGD